jgi:L-rhamnose mutarotase
MNTMKAAGYALPFCMVQTGYGQSQVFLASHLQNRIEHMKRIGFLLKVSQDKIEEYQHIHETVWPEMLSALRKAGWHNYSLFLREDGLLFGYFETLENLQAAVNAMGKEEINARWQEQMAPFFENLGGQHADKGLLELKEVFHLD